MVGSLVSGSLPGLQKRVSMHRLAAHVPAVVLLLALAGACNSKVDANNPYDPQTPVNQQVKGRISGKVTAEAGFLAANVTVQIDGTATGGIPISSLLVQVTPGTNEVDFAADAPPGIYHVAVRIPQFQPLDRYGVTVGVGQAQDLGALQLLAGRGSLKGRIVARSPNVADGAPPIDTRITLFRLVSPLTAPGASTSCNTPGLEDSVSAGMSADGTFTAGSLAVGPYLVLAERDGYVPAVTAGSVNVTAEATADAGQLVLLSGDRMIRFTPPQDAAADPASPATRHLDSALTIVAPPVYNGMRISADPTFTDPVLGDTDFGPVQTALNWTLPAGDGQRSLFLQFRAPTCRTSQVFQGSLVIDTTVPVAQPAQLTTGAACTNAPLATLRLQGADPCPVNSTCAGLYKMHLAIDANLGPQPWVDYSPQLAVDLGPDGARKISWALRDRAGNESPPAVSTINVNSTGPQVATPALLVNGAGPGVVRSRDVTLALQATAATQVELGNASGLDGTGWSPLSATGIVPWRLAAGGDGPRTVVARFRDDCGNVTPEFAVQLSLDTSSRLHGSARLAGAPSHDLTGVTALLLVNGSYVDQGKTAVTGTDGSFAVGGLSAGTWRLAFSHAGWVPRTVDGIVLSQGTDLGVSEITLDVARGDVIGKATLAGEASHDGIRVTAGGLVAFTDSTGAYKLAGLPVGPVLLQAEKGSSYAPTTSAGLIQVTLGGTATAPDLVLQPIPGGLKGSAALAGKTGRAGISVLVQGFTVNGTPQTASTVTDAAGSFAVTSLTAGTYGAALTAPGYRALAQPGLVVGPNQTVDLGRLTLQPATGEVVGKVLLSGQASSAGARASLTQSGVEIVWSTSADDGSYDLKAVPAGSYSLLLSRLGFGSVTVSNVVVDADTLAQIPVQTLTPQVGQVRLVGVGAATNQTTVDVTGNYPNAASARICEDPAVTDPSTFTLAACPRTALGFTVAPPDFDAVALTFKATACPGAASGAICDGAKTVYVQFHDSSGADSSWFSLPLVLDRKPPVGAVVISPLDTTLSSGAVVDQGAPYTRSSSVSVAIVGDDDRTGVPAGGAVSGLVQALLYRGAADANPLVVPLSPGVRTLQGVSLAAGPDGPRQLLLVLQDAAGNVSVSASNLASVTCPDPRASGVVPSACDSIFLDTAPPPSAAFSINPLDASGDLSLGATYALSPLVQLGLDTTLTGKPEDAAVEATLSNDPNFGTAFVQPLPGPRAVLNWVLPAGDGLKTVYVKVRDAAGNLSSAFQASITLDTSSPDAPVPVPVGALTRLQKPALGFGAVPGADGYDVQLSPSATFATGGLVALSPASPLTTGTSTVPAANLADGTWYWRARSWDHAGHTSAWSSPDVFTLDTVPPAAPVLAPIASPTNHATPTLSWSPVAGAASYQAQLDTSNGFASASLVNLGTLGTSIVGPGLADGTWFARVRATDAAGNQSAYSTVISFTVLTAAPANPALIAPAAGSTSGSAQVAISWNSVAGAVSYLLQISTDPTLATPDQYPVTGTSRTLSLANGSWTFRVGAVDAAGNASNLAAAVSRTITVDSSAPVGSTLSINGGATWSTSRTVTLTLSAPADVTQMSLAEGGSLDCTAATYQAFATTKTLLLGADGQRTVQACLRTSAGLTAAASASIYVDTVAPGGTLAIAGGAAFTPRTAVTLSLGASSDTVAMSVVNGASINCATATYEPFSATRSWTLATGDGLQTVTACLKDAAGNTGTISGSITLDTVPPTAATLSINGGAASTNLPAGTVTLAMTTPETVTVALGNETVDCGSATYGPFAATVNNWQLLNQDGVRTVVACIKDQAGWVVTKSASILLDRVAPAGTVNINSGATYATALLVTLGFTSAPDVAQLAVGEGIACGSATYAAFAPTAPFTLASTQGAHTVTACFKDGAGNVASATASIIVATVLPTGTLTIAGGATAVPSAVTTLALTASSGVTQMSIANGSSLNCATATYEPYSASKSWVLAAGDGSKTVTGCLKDAAGNTANISGAVTLNTVPPTAATLSINSGAASTNVAGGTVTLTLTTPETVTVAIGNETLDCATATYGAFAATVNNWPLLNQDGLRTVVACIKDTAGWVVTKSASILLDRAVPVGTVTINGGALWSISNLVSVALTSTSDVAQMSVSVGALNCATASYIAFAPSLASFNLDPGATGVDGAKTVTACFKDGAGNTAQASGTIALDRVDPSGTLVLAGGAATVAARPIAVDLQSVSANVTQMAIAEGSLACASTAYSAFSAHSSFTLSAGDAQKTVVVCLRNPSGRTVSLSGQVTLDTTAPGGTIAINGGAAWSTTTTVAVTGTSPTASTYALANEAIDCAAASYSALSLPTGTFTAAAWSLFPVDGLRTVVACFKDAAGNLSTAQATIQLDQVAPKITLLTIAGGSATVTTDVATLAIASIEAGSPSQLQMYLSRDGTFADGVWEAYATSKSWDLNGTAANVTETRYVYLKLKDAAGNLSAVLSASVIVDFNDPVFSAFTQPYGAAPENQQKLTLSLTASDVSPGYVQDMMISEDSGFAGASWQTFATTTPVTLSPGDGIKMLYAKVRDLSGRTSGTLSTSVTLDTTAPVPDPASPQLQLSSGWSTSNALTLSLAATDTNAASGLSFALFDGTTATTCLSVSYTSFAAAGGSCSAGSCSLNNYSYGFPNAAEGKQLLSLCLRDAAGNVTATPVHSTFFIDGTPPSQVQGLVLAPGSRRITASWGQATDARSGLASYTLQYSTDSTFAAPSQLITTGPSAVISDVTLENRVTWYVRVRAVDVAGNLGAWSTVVSVAPGFAFGTAGGTAMTSRTPLAPEASYAEGTLFLSGVEDYSPSQTALYTLRCTPGTADCTQAGSWAKMSGLYTGGRSIWQYAGSGVLGPVRDTLPVITTRDRLYMVTNERDNSPSTFPTYISLWYCNRSGNNCDYYYWWSRLDIETSTANPVKYHVAVAANSTHLYVAYEVASGTAAPLVVANCGLQTDCSVLSNWTKTGVGAYYGNVNAPSNSSNGSPLSLVANDNLVAVAYQAYTGTNSPVFVTTCPVGTGADCSGASAWTAPSAPMAAYWGYGNYVNPQLTLTKSSLYLVFNYDGGFAGGQQALVARCAQNNVHSCSMTADWTTPPSGAFNPGTFALTSQQPITMRHGDGTLHATYWDQSAQTINYASCPSPDATDCTLTASWRIMQGPSNAGLFTIPTLATYGANVALAWLDPGNKLGLLLPRVATPLQPVAGPGAGALVANWTPSPNAGGYEHLYGVLGGPLWTNRSILADPLYDRSSIASASASDTQSAVRAFNAGGELSDDGMPATVRPFVDQNSANWNATQENTGGCNTVGLEASPSCYAYAAASSGKWSVVVHGGGAANAVSLVICDSTLASGPGSCAAPTAISVTASENPYQVATDGNRVFLLTGGFPNFNIYWCDALAAGNNCSTASNWKVYSPGDTSTEYLPQLAAAGGRLYYVYSNNSSGVLIATSCLHGSVDCTIAANWTTPFSVSSEPSFKGHSVAVDALSGYAHIVRVTGNALKYYLCGATYCFTPSAGVAVVNNLPLAAVPDTARIAVDPTSGVTFTAILDAYGGQPPTAIAAVCPGPLGSYLCYQSTQLKNWGVATLGAAAYNGGAVTDVAVSSTRRIAMYTNIDDQWLASCGSDCGKADNWQKVRVSTRNFEHSVLNARTLTYDPTSQLLGIARPAPNATAMHFFSSGKFVPRD